MSLLRLLLLDRAGKLSLGRLGSRVQEVVGLSALSHGFTFQSLLLLVIVHYEGLVLRELRGKAMEGAL